MMNLCILNLFALAVLMSSALASHLRHPPAHRRLAYHTLTTADLGDVDEDAAIGNPMKGLVESPR